ncbi:hypothetical protein PPERSA_08306 [Pseudocohnilembus persalinus]|uniref:Uncharacterized protein n=1 Tax=Pseudocohnilembus persalinus TaxID=266149 RepID=A0A0V0QPA2_PSEPJ|nr:hypothetical protein PPERSA_08306 [Pseudocohnilembus persalinus]|eukprot:KRX04091.1 hypothetical protein PPERSA_08306 [Pseudocohnilembus persalinus]
MPISFAAILYGLSIYLNPVFIMLSPAILISKNYKKGRSTTYLILFSIIVLTTIGVAMQVSYSLCGSWKFVKESYFKAYHVNLYEPTIGLMWALFSGMFTRYQLFYHSIFAALPLTLIYPIYKIFSKGIRKNNWQVEYNGLVGLVCSTGLFVGFLYFSFITIFEVSLFITMFFTAYYYAFKVQLLLIFGYTASFIAGLTICLTSLWLYGLTGNPNFCFFQTLVCYLFMIATLTETIKEYAKMYPIEEIKEIKEQGLNQIQE